MRFCTIKLCLFYWHCNLSYSSCVHPAVSNILSRSANKEHLDFRRDSFYTRSNSSFCACASNYITIALLTPRLSSASTFIFWTLKCISSRSTCYFLTSFSAIAIRLFKLASSNECRRVSSFLVVVVCSNLHFAMNNFPLFFLLLTLSFRNYSVTYWLIDNFNASLSANSFYFTAKSS